MQNISALDIVLINIVGVSIGFIARRIFNKNNIKLVRHGWQFSIEKIK